MSIGRFEPFWMDRDGPCLYAALHPASARSTVGVVCVPPLLHEQPRSRRFLTEVASGLAALGVPSLRFDFRGTGDSDGRGEELDFASMCADLDLAVAALQSRTGVEQVALLAFRAAALPVRAWLGSGRRVDRVVLWEAVADGSGWLTELQAMDARERAVRPRPRPGVPRTARSDDGQLMGFAASPTFRRDLADGRLDGAHAHGLPVWAVTRDVASLPVDIARSFVLPADAPTFAGGASMEATFFLSPPLERVVNELGHALLERVPA